MPLIKSASKKALRMNVEALMKEVGKSPHVQSRVQALAVAYSEQRQAKKKKKK
jgi:hypothetical protein